MQSPRDVKNELKALLNKYYEIEIELNGIESYEIGDGSKADLRSSELIIEWIKIRREIFYKRARLVVAYINS